MSGSEAVESRLDRPVKPPHIGRKETMNCEPGDLAVCIASPAFPELIGRVFTVTAICQCWPDSWDTDPPQFVVGFRKPVSFMDSTLRPLRDSDGEDEVLRRVGLPHDVHQAA